MKKSLMILCMMFMTGLFTPTQIANASVYRGVEPSQEAAISVEELKAFTELTPAEIQEKTGKKLGFGKRLALKMMQKRIKKQLKKQEKATAPTKGKKGKKTNTDTMSLLSLIFGGAGFLFGFAISGILGLLFGLAGLVLGLLRFSQVSGPDKTMNILGMSLGGAIVLLVLILSFV